MNTHSISMSSNETYDVPMFQYTVPIFIKSLGGLQTVLTKAQAHCTSSGLHESDLLADRLAPDMFPLVKQVQSACDNAKNAVGRLTGITPPVFEDTEQSLGELIARVEATIAYLQTVPESAYAGAEERQVTLPYFPGKYMTGFEYAREYALPNFFFHLVTAYGIIRKNGVAIGKADYTNGLTLRDEESEMLKNSRT